MKFFVDTADVAAIAELNDLGMVDGVTTNPSIILKSGRDILEVTREICSIVSGPVSAEVVAPDHATMMREAAVLRAVDDPEAALRHRALDPEIAGLGGPHDAEDVDHRHNPTSGIPYRPTPAKALTTRAKAFNDRQAVDGLVWPSTASLTARRERSSSASRSRRARGARRT